MKYMNNHYGRNRVFGRCKVPMNLQLFAEDGGAGESEGGAGGSSSGNTGSEEGGAGGEHQEQTLSFDDFLKDPRNQAEFDRRVGKALDTSRTKMQADIETKLAEAKTEAEKMAKMNAEQKAQYAQEKREKELAAREAEISKRELMATAKEQLNEKGIPMELVEVLNYSSAEECTASIDTVAKAFQGAVEKAVNERLLGGKPPKKAEPGQAFTMEQIKGMSAEEINKNWEAVQTSMKATR